MAATLHTTTPRRAVTGMRLLLAGVLLALLAFAAAGKTAAPLAADPVLEARLMTLAAELRCLVCQNQTLAESDAELAVDLRNEIREQMRLGASDEDVIGYLVARYGDFVLYRPPLKASTVLLWTGPAILFLLGIGCLVRTLRRRRRAEGARAPVSAAARARARELLATNGVEEAS